MVFTSIDLLGIIELIMIKLERDCGYYLKSFCYLKGINNYYVQK